MKIKFNPIQKLLLTALATSTFSFVPSEAAAQTPVLADKGAWSQGVYYPNGYGIHTVERHTVGSRGRQALPPVVWPGPRQGTQISVGIGWSKVTRNGAVFGTAGVIHGTQRNAVNAQVHAQNQPTMD